jgi:uncharacterized membrane protein YqhA
MGLPTILFLIFLVLKLTGVITWSWGWVFAPIIIEVVFDLILFAVAGSFIRGVWRRIRGPHQVG